MRAAGPLALLALLAASCGGGEDPLAALRADLTDTNVLVTLVDACAIDHLSMYGYDRATTPFLARLADEAVLFEDVTAPAPYTLASVTSLMTGELVDVHAVTEAGQASALEAPVLAERFRAAGYRTHALSANAHVQRKLGFGRGFDAFLGYAPDLAEVHEVPPEQLDAAIELLTAEPAGPFFAYWHFLPPHAPYDPPEVDRAAFAVHLPNRHAGVGPPEPGSLEVLMPLSHGAFEPPPDQRAAIEDLYDASLVHVDRTLARLGAALEARGLLEDTLWVVVSDHGEAFGRHGLWQHARTVYDEMVRVPLLVRLPGGARGGERVATPVGLTDLTATLVDLYALEGPRPWSSTSLGPLLAGAVDALGERPPIVTRTAGPGEHVALRSGRWKLIHRLAVPGEGPAAQGDGTWELYDLEDDPLEARRLPANTPEARALRRELAEFRREARRRARTAEGVVLDPETQKRLEEIGYVGDERPAGD